MVVAGPTAVGKTDLCVRLAQNFTTEIISADSRQFFKELSIGTAKPTSDEMGGIPHHFIDFIGIQEEFSSGRFEVAVLELLTKLFPKHPVVLMTGGSGLYIQAVCHGMNDIPKIDLSYREELYEEFKKTGLQPLVEELENKDPVYFNKVDLQNTQRVIRALEVCRGTGRPYSDFRQDKQVERDFNIIKIGLDRDREELFQRIDLRMDQMITEGLFEEAEKYYPHRHLNALKTVGYKEIFGYLDGEYDKTEAVRLLKRNTRRYAKRQLTWFKKDPDFQWFHPDKFEEIVHFIHAKTKAF